MRSVHPPRPKADPTTDKPQPTATVTVIFRDDEFPSQTFKLVTEIVNTEHKLAIFQDGSKTETMYPWSMIFKVQTVTD